MYMNELHKTIKSVIYAAMIAVILSGAYLNVKHAEAKNLPGVRHAASFKKKVRVKVIITPSCDLGFKSGKKLVAAPTWFTTEVKGFSCREQKILSRLAFLESTYNRNAVNKHNKYATGLYQILPSSWDECKKNGKGGTDHLCALYHFNRNKARFEAYTRNTYLFNF